MIIAGNCTPDESGNGIRIIYFAMAGNVEGEPLLPISVHITRVEDGASLCTHLLFYKSSPSVSMTVFTSPVHDL